MERWHVPFLGLTEIPSTLTDFEIDRFFTFTDRELTELKGRRTALLKVAAALQLGCLKLSGRTLSRFKIIPRNVLDHIGRQLKVDSPRLASLRTLYRRRERTRWDHQVWAVHTAGFHFLEERQQRVLCSHLTDQATQAASIDELVTVAREWLYDHSIVIPGDRTLRDLARKAFIETERGLYVTICEAIPELVRRRWAIDLLKRREPDGITMLEWLRTPPSKASKTELSDQFERIKTLKALGVDRYELSDIPYEKLQALAQGMRARRPSRFRNRQEPRRTLELVAFLRLSLLHTTDVALHLLGRKTHELVRSAKVAAEKTIRHQLATKTTTLLRIQRDAFDSSLPDAEFRAHVRAILRPEVCPPLLNKSAAMREQLAHERRKLQPLLATVASLRIGARAGETTVEALNTLARLYASQATCLPRDHGCGYPKPWRGMVEGEDREQALGALEAATLMSLRGAFKRGSVWVDHSVSFRNPDHILIHADRWVASRRRRYEALSLPESPEPFLKRILASVEAGLAAAAEAVRHGRVRIDGSAIRMRAMKAAQPPPAIEHFKTTLFAGIAPTQLPRILLDVDSQIRFSWVLLGRPPVHDAELLGLYGALLAHGTALTAAGVAKMIPALDEDRIRRAMRLLESDGVVAEANRVVVEYQRRHRVARHWGAANLASSDMMSLDASRHLWNARVDPRRRTYAIGTYTHLLDQWGIVYDQPIVLLQRQAGAALEGVVRQRDVRIERIAVDTHGYTDFALAIARLLRFDLCPRLQNLKERRLYIPKDLTVPGELEPAVDRDVSLRAIRKGYDGLVRVAASIETGTTSAVLALDRYGSAARGDAVYTAGVHLGRLLRTIFLCDYFTNDTFQREIRRVLSRGEHVHTLQRAIYTEPVPSARGRRPEELVTISGSLRLLTNLCLAWTTHRIEGVLEHRPDLVQPEMLARISPAHTEHINFRGTFTFPIELYRQRLFQEAVAEDELS